MKKALVVGINYYENVNIPSLNGCVNDAYNVKSVLERHGDGSVNFGVRIMTSNSSNEQVTKRDLLNEIRSLFSGQDNIALLYFSGHGYASETGGCLMPSDCRDENDGIPFRDVLAIANRSQVQNKVIVLDCCFSGDIGNVPNSNSFLEINKGTTILTASTENQYALEEGGSGVFTELFVDALNGAAANLVGHITPGSVYAHIDQSLGSWDQRPVFKTNVQSFISLRKTQPFLELQEIQRIIEFFPEPGYEYQLDPSYEPERGLGQDDIVAPYPLHTSIFSLMQKYNRVNLVVPVGTTHMYHAAMESKSCKLTALGEHYRRLVYKERI